MQFEMKLTENMVWLKLKDDQIWKFDPSYGS